eukprot:TRINITY_DN24988_c0_g1_i1.p1 TRINITY_DN24988_c0_g1~~TRINITY_DN24988_c0_g1_i1.p1  ORF type:complete len:156 (+),score=20.47 TRINITY_DN24988_c0_g1_i1:71-538(+)
MPTVQTNGSERTISSDRACNLVDNLIESGTSFKMEFKPTESKVLRDVSKLLKNHHDAGHIVAPEFLTLSDGKVKGAIVGSVVGGVLAVGAVVTVIIAGAACPVIVLAIIGGVILGALCTAAGAAIGSQCKVMKVTVKVIDGVTVISGGEVPLERA